MVQKFIVTGPDRELMGWRYYFVSGRGWPKEPLEVEVFDGPEETIEKPTEDGSSRKVPHPTRLTRAEFDKVRNDARLSVRAVDDAGAKELKVNVVEMVDENKQLKAQVAALNDEVAILKLKLEECDKMLAEATKPPMREPVLARPKKDK
jgi:hypothetical protein